MKKILLIMLTVGFLLSSCSKTEPQPNCEQGGTEVTP